MADLSFMPQVTVILPVYNRKHLIQRAITSVLKQTFKEWELLIVDDGSTDGVEDIIIPLVLKNPRVRYLKQSNRGVAISRNNGIYAALGRYITFLDSDDEYKPNHLAARMDYLTQHPDVKIIHGGVELIGPAESHYVEDVFNPGQLIHLSECCIGSTFFGERDAFLLSGGFKALAYSAESEFLPRVSKRFTVAKVDFPTYRYYTGLEDSVCTLRKNKNM